MEEKKSNSIYKNIMIVIITALITCVITTIVVYNSVNVQGGINSNNNFIANFVNSVKNTFTGQNNNSVDIEDKIQEINAKLNEQYIGEVDEEKLIEGALEGYVAALGDEYTEYLTKDEVTAIIESVDGSYVGVGLYIANNTQTNEILVIGVIENSPAHKNGILAGDIIKKVDDIEYTGEQLTQASNHMKGVEGTQVKITIERNNEQKELNITRETIKFNCIGSEKLENNIGYIEITSFDGGCAADFEKAYKELQSQGIKSLIIDLRNNGGGLVEEALQIAKLIAPKGSKLLITKDKNGNEEISTSDKEPIINVPIVILVNEYTASASEILASAIRENINTKVIGVNTYGKGIIQGIFLFKDQETGLKVTMQEYYTPKHNKIHKIGISPDIEVELPEEWKGHTNIEKQYDTQLNKALELLK